MQRLLVHNQIGVWVAIVFLVSASFVFIGRLAQWSPAVERSLGILELALAIPVVYLLVQAKADERSLLYVVQLSVVLGYLVLALAFDWMLPFEFRTVRWMTILYVTVFFGACGALVGMASLSGKGWTIIASVLFFGTGVLAFVQRSVTGR